MRDGVVFNNAVIVTTTLHGVTCSPIPLPSTIITTSCWLLATIYSKCIIGELLLVTFHEDTQGWVEVQLHSVLTSTLDEGRWRTSCPGSFTPDKSPGTHRRRLGRPQRRSARVLLHRKSLAPIVDRIPDGPTRSESPYRLSYPILCWIHLEARCSKFMIATQYVIA